MPWLISTLVAAFLSLMAGGAQSSPPGHTHPSANHQRNGGCGQEGGAGAAEVVYSCGIGFSGIQVLHQPPHTGSRSQERSPDSRTQPRRRGTGSHEGGAGEIEEMSGAPRKLRTAVTGLLALGYRPHRRTHRSGPCPPIGITGSRVILVGRWDRTLRPWVGTRTPGTGGTGSSPWFSSRPRRS
jgi:hypothetical protein